MDTVVDAIQSREVSFLGADDNKLKGSLWADPKGTCGTVILLHGGGQTRHSWQGTAEALARRGWRAICIDQRGHGESDWVGSGDYSFDAFARDLGCFSREIEREYGTVPAVIGASLGGLAGMLALGEGVANASALVLVDISPFVKPDGVARILGFMAEKSEEGFASLEDAAEAIARYLPHRPKPPSLAGLSKNLRQHADGRYRWHWDPRFLDTRRNAHEHADETRTRVIDVARKLSVPVLLVRGRESELIGEDEAQMFLELVPHARMTDVSGARHMVAGDRNDVFTDAVLEFFGSL